MSIDAGVARSSCHLFTLLQRNVNVILKADVSLRQAIVYQIHAVLFLAITHADVLRLDIPVHETPAMDILKPHQELICHHQDCF